jgi:hypothetical protein
MVGMACSDVMNKAKIIDKMSKDDPFEVIIVIWLGFDALI